MSVIFSVLIVIVCILLVLIVLVQNPKGGGLSSAFGGSGTQMMGVQKTNDFLEKGTWFLAIALVVLTLLSNVMVSKGDGSSSTEGADSSILGEDVTPDPAADQNNYQVPTGVQQNSGGEINFDETEE